MKTFTDEQIQDIIYLYTEERKSINFIAKKYNVSNTVIRTVFKHNKIAIRTTQEANGRKTHLTNEQIEEIIYNYTVLKQGLQTCGKKYNYSQYLVEKLLKERGIKKRNYTESKQVTRIYNINDDYFKTQSHSMGYILGLLASDGNVSRKENKISIQLQAADIDLLTKINEELGSNRPIDKYTTSAGRDTCKLQVWSAAIKNDLAKYNIIPNKTLVLEPPDFLSKEFIPDFIRGYFDGDGSIYIKDKNKKIVQFDGASKKMIDWIRNSLNNYGITTNSYSTYTTDNGILMYRLIYYNQNTVQKIGELFYQDDSNLCLLRKKEKFFPRDSTSLGQGRIAMLNLHE